jgi:hypothetical protein
MTFKRALYASTLAAGIGMAGLLDCGLPAAAADPGPQCNAPNRPPCGQDQHRDDRGQGDWNNRGPDQGGWHNRGSTERPAGDSNACGQRRGWGFGSRMWIPL